MRKRKEIQTIRGELENVARLPQSACGNARFKFTVGGVELRTGVNCALADDLKNIVHYVEPHFIECTYKEIRGHLTIQSIKKV